MNRALDRAVEAKAVSFEEWMRKTKAPYNQDQPNELERICSFGSKPPHFSERISVPVAVGFDEELK
jgi:hypothetical protein